MARSRTDPFIRSLAKQKAEDAMWGVPESPEFSSVQRLMNEFQSHARDEERWLSSYREIAEESTDPLTGFLLNLIVADEERHHKLMARMISKLEDELAWTSAKRTVRTGVESGARRKRLLGAVERMVGAEQKGIQEYEHLKKASRNLRRDVFELLYGTMIRDSQKHMAILEFLRRRLSAS